MKHCAPKAKSQSVAALGFQPRLQLKGFLSASSPLTWLLAKKKGSQSKCRSWVLSQLRFNQ